MRTENISEKGQALSAGRAVIGCSLQVVMSACVCVCVCVHQLVMRFLGRGVAWPPLLRASADQMLNVPEKMIGKRSAPAP